MVDVGTGAAGTDFRLLIAENYPGVAGTVSSTMTWDNTGGGTYADKSVDGWTACYQASVQVPSGTLTA